MSSSFVLPDTGVESLCCIPENNVMLYVYHASTLKIMTWKRVTNKGLISKICKQLIYMAQYQNNKQPNQKTGQKA